MSHDPGTTARPMTEAEARRLFPLTWEGIQKETDISELIRWGNLHFKASDPTIQRWFLDRIEALRGK